MKNNYLITIFILFLLNFLSTTTYASHYMGGEITWECIPTGHTNAGKYVFQMKVYRECGGIQFGSTQTLLSNSPAGSISLTEIAGWPKDISPICNSNPNFSHITCATATTPNMGAIEEHIYRSQPIQLNGTPPQNGWMFYWGSCCRNPSTNLSANGSWLLRAIMYPYGSQNMYPCFDDSPAFSEPPQTVVCAAYPTIINYHAWDKDLDSLHYEWGTPLLSTGIPVTAYIAGYSYLNPLPDLAKNPLNIAGKINPATGNITFTSYTTGAFVTSVKISAFKTGIKVAEIWRDMQIVISSCGTNTPPQFSITYTNGQALTSDTIVVNAGDSIDLILNGISMQLLPNGAQKTIEMRINGIQFGSYIPANGSNPPSLNEQVGCINPPCAVLNPAPGPSNPLSNLINVQSHFHWQTDCGHVQINYCCHQYFNTYRFSFMIKDDFCPIPANINKDIYITVVKTPLPKIKTNNVHYNYTLMSADLSWKKYNDPDSAFISYDLYHSNTYTGPYTLIDSIKNINQIVYSHNIGVAQQAYYYIRLRAFSCNQIDTSDQSNILSLNITNLNTVSETHFELFQNEPNPTNGSTKIRYSIDKAAKGVFQLLDFTGRIVYEQDLQSNYGINSIILETSQFAKGVYFYRVEFGEVMGVKKLIIMK